MRSYDALADLLDALQSHVSRLLEQDNDRLLIGLPRFLEVLKTDPLLSSAISSLISDADQKNEQFGAHDAQIRHELKTLWPRYRALLEEKLPIDTRKLRIFNARGSFEVFERRLESSDTPEIRHDKEPTEDPSNAGELITQLTHWSSGWLQDDSDEVADLRQRFEVLRQRHQYAFRQFWLDGRNTAGTALRRLDDLSQTMNRPPGDGSDTDTTIRRLEHVRVRDLLAVLYDPSNFPSEDQRRALEEAANSVRRDVRLVHQEIRAVLLLRRSRLWLIRRFAARCERYDADELRRLCSSEKEPEKRLTARFARFLFDQGLNPITDAPVARLKPDVLDLGFPFYVEAKQYGREGKDVRSALKRAFGQVLGTWGRLRATHELNEAFLLVFRLDGPRVEMPEVVRLDGRTLYTWLVDLVPPRRAGSREKFVPIVITGEEVLSWYDDANQLRLATSSTPRKELARERRAPPGRRATGPSRSR
jgi:hypothetical protein